MIDLVPMLKRETPGGVVGGSFFSGFSLRGLS